MSNKDKVYLLCWEIQHTAEIIWGSLNNLSEDFKHTGTIDIDIGNQIYNVRVLEGQLEMLQSKSKN